MSTRRNFTYLIALMILAVIATTACGPEFDETQFAQVNPGIRTYSVEDFEMIGFKVVKNYDVEGLTGATVAVYGFLKSIGLTPQSYELRFYDSHEDAVQFGTSFAEEITGEGAVVLVKDMSWSAGAKEQREASSESGGFESFYWNYAIFGNVVMLCEGDWPEQSLEVCQQLQDVLEPPVSG